jgi:hypothetical protein
MWELLFGALGGLFGGLFRLAPEVLKLIDKKSERAHELAMFGLQTDLEKMRGTFRMEERYAEYSTAQLDTIKEAFMEQATTAKEAGPFVSAISALVRPGITWALFFMYATVKLAALVMALQSGGPWTDIVVNTWGAEDVAMFNMVLTFWFVGRSIEKYQK